MSRIRECREKHSLTQDDVALKVGVSRQTIIAVEKGNYVPSVGLAMDLAKLFRKPVEEIFYWK